VSCIELNEDITLTIPAGDSSPFVERYGPSLHWMLDIAADAVPEERAAVERLRRAVRRLVAKRGARIGARDLKIALGGVLEAIERDLGPVPSRPRFGFTRSARAQQPRTTDRAIGLVGNVEWELALGAGDWMPLLQHHRAAVEWLFDVAHSTTTKLTGSRQREAIARVRAAHRRLDHASVLVDRADVRSVATLVLVALERDLGPARERPRGRFCMPTAAEVFGAGVAELLRAAGRQLGKAVEL